MPVRFDVLPVDQYEISSSSGRKPNTRRNRSLVDVCGTEPLVLRSPKALTKLSSLFFSDLFLLIHDGVQCGSSSGKRCYLQTRSPYFRTDNKINVLLVLDEPRCTGTHSERYYTARLTQTSHSHSHSFFFRGSRKRMTFDLVLTWLRVRGQVFPHSSVVPHYGSFPAFEYPQLTIRTRRHLASFRAASPVCRSVQGQLPVLAEECGEWNLDRLLSKASVTPFRS